MKRIEEQNEDYKKIAFLALTWVVNVKRPLAVLELQTALAIEPDSKSLDRENILAVDTILSVCAGLVIIDGEQSVVRLVHYTVQEYLDPILHQIFPNAQTEITHCLLTYLAFDEVRSLYQIGTVTYLPLLQYSGYYCLMHAAGPPEVALRNLILEFLDWAAYASRWAISPIMGLITMEL
jgi:hypothetical protein